MDSGCELYEEILRRRLDDYLEGNGKLSDTQMGFSIGKGTVDALNILKSVVGSEISKER